MPFPTKTKGLKGKVSYLRVHGKAEQPKCLPSCPGSWTPSPREGSWELNAGDVEKSLTLGGPGVHEGCKESKAKSSSPTLPRVGRPPAHLQGPYWHSCLVLPCLVIFMISARHQDNTEK